MARDLIGMVKRGIKKPPQYIVQRVLQEIHAQAERYIAPYRAQRLSGASIAKRVGYSSVSEWWSALGARPYLTQTQMSAADLERICPGERTRIFAAARHAIDHRVNLLGSGEIQLGAEIDWHSDYKTGYRWSPAYCRDIEYTNLDQSSDVKFPWEVSRMQWMIPLGQAYMLSGDEQFAIAARDLLDDWIRSNPYACSVNWSCTMDVALRILSWTWFFHAFKNSGAWAEPEFRERFLQTLYLHGDFTARHLEKSDVNGNHYTADAAGLVFAGLFFGDGAAPQQWLRLGWDILCGELPLQVFPDGVDFEASVPYHRLVQELFLLPALYRRCHGLDVAGTYRERVMAMAKFTAAYSRRDGSVPLWGDADDARALPFGGQALNDHRYLLALVGLGFGAEDLTERFSGSRSEALWLFGPEAAGTLPDRTDLEMDQPSAAFPDGGFYILRNSRDHVFVDCGPLGLSGRGGHGHNDLLSFEAMLDGIHLISDCGAYLYTASYKERNLFRSTAYHNTPKVDGEEINRFIRWDYLWFLHNDAAPEVRGTEFGRSNIDRLVLSHSGYRRLTSPVTPVRTIELHHVSHKLVVHDVFEGQGEHQLEIPLHLAVGVELHKQENSRVLLTAGGQQFSISWSDAEAWELHVERGRVSPSYGVAHPIVVLRWRRNGLLTSLTVTIEPVALSLSSVA